MARATVTAVRVRTAKRPTKKAAAVVTRSRRVTKKKVARAAAATRHGGISSKAVQQATGRTWDQWLAALDKAGAQAMSHKEIAAMLHERFACPPWWSQMVTVGYEQARGLREKHQVVGGYSASASKVVNVPIAMLYEAWSNSNLRGKWLGPADMVVRKATTNRSIRATWEPEAKTPTSVEVMFYSKGVGKSQVTVQHGKLRSAAAVQKAKSYWHARLDALKGSLEAGA